jgi:hypothetical protein
MLPKNEWTPELDVFLAECVIRNCFNFDLIALEVNKHAKKLGYDFGAASAMGLFSSEKCRIRWSYIHLKVMYENNFVEKTRSECATS